MTVPQPPGKQCLAGHECPEGSADQSACVSGLYQPNVGQGACLVCPAGKYCDQTEAIAEQQSGAGAPSHGVVTPKDCLPGFYCPNGTESARQYPCPVGKYSNTSNLESGSECRLCPQGFYCEAENITQPTAQCSPGYYCVLGATTPTPSLSVRGGPCPQGFWCPQGASWPAACPKGTYGHTDKISSESDCTICPPGEFCDQVSLTAPNGSCLAGFYCTNGSKQANPNGQSYGNECPPGYYCPQHSYVPLACPKGTYNPDNQRTNDSSYLPCDPG